MMGILTLLLAIVALVVSLVSVWFVSVMVKRANIVNRQFYEGNVRGSIKLLEDLTRSMEAALHTAGKLEKAEKKDLENNCGPSNQSPRGRDPGIAGDGRSTGEESSG